MLKKLWHFISRENRVGLIVFIAFSTWGFIGCTIMYFTPLSALDRYEGIVTSLKVRDNKRILASNYGYRGRSNIRIKINSSSKTFKLRDLQKYDDMISDIEVKDTVVIYTKFLYQYIFTPVTWNAICQIEKGGRVYYRYSSHKFGYFFGMLAFGAVSVFFWLFLIIEIYTDKYVRQKYLNTKPPTLTLRDYKG